MDLKSFETIGRRIKQARKAKGQDQASLAKLIGVLPSRISLLERDRAHLVASEASFFCKILDVDLNWLIDGSIRSEYELFLTLNLDYSEYRNVPEHAKEKWLEKHTQRFALQGINVAQQIQTIIKKSPETAVSA
jgi:transcriptional regulator with XRE-family HTH domain